MVDPNEQQSALVCSHQSWHSLHSVTGLLLEAPQLLSCVQMATMVHWDLQVSIDQHNPELRLDSHCCQHCLQGKPRVPDGAGLPRGGPSGCPRAAGLAVTCCRQGSKKCVRLSANQACIIECKYSGCFCKGPPLTSVELQQDLPVLQLQPNRSCVDLSVSQIQQKPSKLCVCQYSTQTTCTLEENKFSYPWDKCRILRFGTK